MNVDDLRTLFAATLEIDPDFVDADTDFFYAGGHSLSALALAVAVEQKTGVPVKVRDVFECASPASLYERLSATMAPAPTEPHVTAGLDPAVRWLWMERQRGDVAPAAYNVPCLLRVDGAVDVDRMHAAVQRLHDRHSALRTTFVEERGEPRAVVHADGAPLRIAEFDDETARQAFVAGQIDEPFDPTIAPLARLTLLRRADGAHELLIVTDHLICDGAGLDILANDLVRLYAGVEVPVLAGGTVAGDPASALAHWRTVLEPLPVPTSLPVRQQRHAPVTGTALLSHRLDATTVADLERLASDAHGGLFVAFAAGVARALARLTGAAEICLGTAVDLRARRRQADAVGFHVATLPLRFAAFDSPGAVLAEAAAVTVDAIDYSDVTYGDLIAALDPPRQPWRNPLFDAWVIRYPRVDTGALQPGGIRLHGGPVATRYGLFELSFQFVEHEDHYNLVLQYDPQRYDDTTAADILDRIVESLSWLTGHGDALTAESEPVFTGFRF